MTEISKIMTPDPLSVTQHANVNKARMLMAEHKIRHLPVKDIETGRVAGLISQKALLANAIKIINHRGFDQLEYTEKSMDVESIMDKSPAVFEVNADVIDVAKSLRDQRSGCVTIEENGKLVGVVTSSDFVKLVVDQMSD